MDARARRGHSRFKCCIAQQFNQHIRLPAKPLEFANQWRDNTVGALPPCAEFDFARWPVRHR
jgi:hypothetical protein